MYPPNLWNSISPPFSWLWFHQIVDLFNISTVPFLSTPGPQQGGKIGPFGHLSRFSTITRERLDGPLWNLNPIVFRLDPKNNKGGLVFCLGFYVLRKTKNFEGGGVFQGLIRLNRGTDKRAGGERGKGCLLLNLLVGVLGWLSCFVLHCIFIVKQFSMILHNTALYC